MEKLLDAFGLPVFFGAMAVFAMVRVKNAPFYKLMWASLIFALALIGWLDDERIAATRLIELAMFAPMVLFGIISTVRNETQQQLSWRLLLDRWGVPIPAKRR